MTQSRSKKVAETTENTTQDEVLELLKQMKSEIDSLKQENAMLKNSKPSISLNADKDPFDVNRMVMVVHMDDLVDGLCTVVKGDTEYRFNKIGDKHRIRLGELEKIMSKSKKFFEQGLLIIADEDVNDYFGLEKIELINVDTYKNIYKLSAEELGRLFQSLCPAHKDMVLRHWTLECHKNNNLAYKDLNKLTVLNQLSGGKTQHLMSNLSI